MQFRNYDFIDSKSFAGKIILTSFPGLNPNGLFEQKILKKYFGEDVILPIRAHVDSKRYLSSVEDGYYESLSEASKLSLKVQGGPFNKEEAEEFIKKPFMDKAVELRRFDDLAKILNKKTPDVEHFRPYLEDARNSFLANQS